MIQIIWDLRIDYLASLAKAYQDMGYTVRLRINEKQLEIYKKGYKINDDTEGWIQ